MTIVITPELTMKEIGRGAAEVYADALQVGLITWSPDHMTTGWYATYANGDETVRCSDRAAALECIRLQHAAVQRLVRSIRSLRPAHDAGDLSSQAVWGRGYNEGLRDVEQLLQQVVGRAPKGEGFTAITQ